MALIRTGGGITQISGSFGGVTAQRSRSGPAIRTRIAGVQPRSTAQLIVRARHQSITRAWSGTLTNANRLAWRAFAAATPQLNRLGNTQLLSGYAFFVKLNLVILAAGGTLITAPPGSLAVTAPTGAFPVVVAGALNASVTGPGLAANETVQFQFTGPLRAGHFYVANKFLTVKYAVAMNADVNVATEWGNIYGTTPFGSGSILAQRGSVVNTVTGAQSVGVTGFVTL